MNELKTKEEYWVAIAQCKNLFPLYDSFYVSEDEHANYFVVLNENNEGIIFDRKTWKYKILKNFEV